MRVIAAGLGRAPSTVSREVAANGGRGRYRAAPADQLAWARARRRKVCKLGTHPALRAIVGEQLKRKWSPQQNAGWLKTTYPNDPEMQASHETIYRTLLIQSRGASLNVATDFGRSPPVAAWRRCDASTAAIRTSGVEVP